MPTVITTFGEDYYRRYGKECIESLVKHWPGKIVAYYEDNPPADYTGEVEYRNLMDQPELVHFLKWTKMVPLTQGILPNGKYHYNFDAHKFARKVFAITDYAKAGEPFFFVGADTRCTKPITEEFLDGLMGEKPGCFLLRRHIPFGKYSAHVESDFAGYNPQDKDMKNLLTAYRQAYINGSFLELRGWHDCIILDTLLDVFKLTPRVNNISDGVKGDGELGLHVWPNTILAEYMVHLKGRMKEGKVAA